LSDEEKRAPIALLGFGNVGRALVEHLSSRAHSAPERIRIAAVADSNGLVVVNDAERLHSLLEQKRSTGRVRGFGEGSDPEASLIDALSRLGVEVLVESLPTNIEDGQPALDLVEAALLRGIHVVTVNKGPMVHGFERLHTAARTGSARIGFSGTTGVALPDELAPAGVFEIRGVLNGTTNYILTAMQERGVPFKEALAQAQADGIAEPDPRLDVEGWDTACKILILAKASMRADCVLGRVSRIGIGPETESLIRVARESDRIVRLVGRARIWQGRVRVSVAPKLLTRESPLFSVSGTSKAAVFSTKTKGDVVVSARSGRDAIARIILDDVERVLS
jgi:homoserine dehydrogenase